jgi:WD40 repeat protein
MGLRLPVYEVVRIGIQVASGLLAAHRAGVLHRDIKPENIMIAADGDVKILDFGIAQLKEPYLSPVDSRFVSGSSFQTTQTSVIAGTPGYASPEQLSGLPLDARTDIFSLGVLLFELSTGRKPFDGETIAGSDAPAARVFRADVPSDLERIIGKALKKNRDERYGSITEMLSELRGFSRVTGEAMDSTQRANEMFRQYLSIYAVDKRALVPLAKLYSIARYSDMNRGEREKELFRKSLRSGLMKAGGMILLILLAAGFLSVNETWEETILKDGHTRAVRQVAFSPGGKLLVSAGEDAKVIVWDFERRMHLAVFTDHTKTVSSVAFSPDGEWFATGSHDKSVIIWDAKRLVKAAVLPNLPGIVSALAFSPDSRLLACMAHESNNQGHVELWNTGDWDKVREMAGPSREYGRIFFSPDGKQLITNAGAKWDISTGKSMPTEEFPEGVNWLTLSPDSTRMLAINSSGNVNLTDLMQHRQTMYSAHQDSGRAAAFSPDGRLGATGSDDIVLWDAASMTKLARFEASSIVWNIVFSPNGRWLVSSHGDSSILIWDVAERRLAAALNGHAGAVRGVTFSPDGQRVASASEDRSLIVWDAGSGQKLAVKQGPSSRLTGVAFSSDGKQVAASEFMDTVILWNVEKDTSPIHGELTSAAYCVAISPDNNSIASTHGIYDAHDGHLIIHLGEAIEKGEMYGAAFSPDGRWLAGATAQGLVVLLDARTWQVHEKIKVADATFIAISFSPDGKHVATGEDEGNVRLWSIEPLHQVAILGRHTSRIKSVAFAPNGKEVASAGDDNTIRIWDVNGGGLVREIGTHTKPVLSVAYSPDGKRIVSGEHDDSVRLYTRHRYLWGHRLD